jgi:hypothetical protein
MEIQAIILVQCLDINSIFYTNDSSMVSHAQKVQSKPHK